MSNFIVRAGNTEITLTTANTVYNSDSVRLTNISANACLITVAGSRTATFTLLAGSNCLVLKQNTDTLAANSSGVILAVPAAIL